ncbi:hypothetical protein [Halobellus sp. EA9]|uniref:hypothetical protein n=1 Tax=Halobellus sp. EA9 TaxID=3421647 RepID=UPI003EC089A5
MSSPQRIRIRCDCGEWLERSTDAPTTECECGATYVVTVTDITPPETVGEAGTETRGSAVESLNPAPRD